MLTEDAHHSGATLRDVKIGQEGVGAERGGAEALEESAGSDGGTGAGRPAWPGVE